MSYTWAAGPSCAPLSGNTSSPGLLPVLQTRPSLFNTEREKIRQKHPQDITPSEGGPHQNTALRSRARRQPPGHNFLPFSIPPPPSKRLLTDHLQGETELYSKRQQAQKKKGKTKTPKGPPAPPEAERGAGGGRGDAGRRLPFAARLSFLLSTRTGSLYSQPDTRFQRYCTTV